MCFLKYICWSPSSFSRHRDKFSKVQSDQIQFLFTFSKVQDEWTLSWLSYLWYGVSDSSASGWLSDDLWDSSWLRSGPTTLTTLWSSSWGDFGRKCRGLSDLQHTHQQEPAAEPPTWASSRTTSSTSTSTRTSSRTTSSTSTNTSLWEPPAAAPPKRIMVARRQKALAVQLTTHAPPNTELPAAIQTRKASGCYKFFLLWY